MSKVRGRRPAQKDQEELKFEMTPMIDVTFLILIFFMCTLQFKTLEGKLSSYLPTNEGLGPDSGVEMEKARVVLKVHPQDASLPTGKRRVQVFHSGSGKPVGTLTPMALDGRPAMLADPPSTWDSVRRYADRVRKIEPDAQAILEARPDVPHEAAVQALDCLHTCGFTHISFAGIPKRLIRDLEARKIR